MHNIVHRDSSINVSLSPDQHLVSNVAKWRTGAVVQRGIYAGGDGAEIMGGPSPFPSPPPPITRPFLSRPSETGPEAGVKGFSRENFGILHCCRRVLAHNGMLNVVWKVETQCFTSQLHFFAEKY